MKKYWKLIQQHLGVDADGIPGPKTALALLDRLGIRQPEQSWPSQEEVRSGKSVFGRAGDESNMTSIKLPYIMRLGKLQPVSIPEFSLWSMLLWDVLTYEELHKKFYDKMEETEIEPSSFDKSLEMLVKRKLIIKGVGYTGADALYNMLSDTYVIPLRGVQGTRKLMNVAKLLKQKKVNFFEAVYLLQPEKSSVAERRIMKLVLQTPLSVPELVRCFENNVRDVSSADKGISAIYTEESDNQARLNNASSLSDYRHDVLEATANLYLTRQVILEHA